MIRLVREIATGSAKHRFGVGTTPDETSQRHRFVASSPLTTFHRVGVPTDLGVDGVAQSEALVAQLGDEFGVGIVVRRVDVTNGFEKTEWKKRVDRR